MSQTKSQLTACISNAELQLSNRERMLIKNFRAMEEVAQHTLVDVSEEWARILPAERLRLKLVGAD
jgi:hypothetical protein